MAEIAFWASLGLIAYTVLGYGTLVRVLAQMRGRRPARTQAIRPRVSVIIAAYNEAPRLADRVRNLLASAYPPDLLEVLVGSDGSTDGTAEVVSAFGSQVRASRSTSAGERPRC